MIRDVFFSLFVVTTACLGAVGLATTIVLIMAVAGCVSVSQVTEGFQNLVDYGNFLVSAYGVGSTISILRAAYPYAVERVKLWLRAMSNADSLELLTAELRTLKQKLGEK